MMGRDRSQQGEAQVWALDLGSQGEAQGEMPTGLFPAGFVVFPISSISASLPQSSKLCPAAEDNSLQKDTDLLGEICR